MLGTCVSSHGRLSQFPSGQSSRGWSKQVNVNEESAPASFSSPHLQLSVLWSEEELQQRNESLDKYFCWTKTTKITLEVSLHKQARVSFLHTFLHPAGFVCVIFLTLHKFC